VARSDELQTSRLARSESAERASTPAFEELIAPLEEKACRRLNGPGLIECRAAFAEHPEGFRRCTERALAKADRYDPVGVLVRMVRDGDCLVRQRERVAAPTPQAIEECIGCGERRAVDVETLRCDECRDEGGSR